MNMRLTLRELQELLTLARMVEWQVAEMRWRIVQQYGNNLHERWSTSWAVLPTFDHHAVQFFWTIFRSLHNATVDDIPQHLIVGKSLRKIQMQKDRIRLSEVLLYEWLPIRNMILTWYGWDASVAISHSTMPKLNTSLLVEKTPSFKLSGAIQRTGNKPLVPLR